MEPPERTSQSHNGAIAMELEKALESLSNHRWWLFCIFLLSCTPGIFNAWHIMVSNFYAFTPTHWCQVKELSDANWTTKQIREVSMPKPISEDKSSCTMISWNYTHLVDLGYEEALTYVNSTSIPKEIPCKTFSFDDKEPYSSVVSQWSLVCDHKIDKTNVQASIAIGKLFGGILFGFIADRYGRKTSFVLSCATYMAFGPLAAFAPTFWIFIATRFMIGIAGSGCYETGFTLSLNSVNFGTNQHVYTFLSGAVEIPGYVLPLFILLYLGRKSTIAILFFITGAILVAISGISKEHKNLILMMAMLGRFAGVAVFGVVVVYTSELFPTTTRNFAVGSSLAVSQFGSIYAPYIVDFLSVFGWYVPSTLCGCAALVCSALMLLLPETRGRPLQQTVDELMMSEDRVSLHNCCRIS